MRCFIYWNLHRKCWSIKALSGPDKGRVKYHASAFTLEDATFKVSEAGRQRVISEQRKNVHAGIVGTLAGWLDMDGDQGSIERDYYGFGSAPSVPVTYNPYRCGSFTTTGEHRLPVSGAASVIAKGRDVHAYQPRSI